MYKRTNWIDKKTIITADAMNNIEDGIVEKISLNNESGYSINLIENDSIVNQIETIDSTGNKNVFTVAASVGHVKDVKTGRMQDQINNIFYERTARTFSSNGEMIVVPNAEDGYVINAKIEGNTITNLLNADSLKSSAGSVKIDVQKNGLNDITFTQKKYNQINVMIDEVIPLKANTTYTLYYRYMYFDFNGGSHNVYIRQATTNGELIAQSVDSPDLLGQLRKLTFTTTKDYDKPLIMFSSYPSNFDVGELFRDRTVRINNICLIEGDADLISPIADLGINSTKAIIENNGEIYSFYASEEDKLADKVIELGATNTKKDSLEILDDGSAIYTQNTAYSEDGNSRVDLDKPIVTIIDKSLVPIIKTYKKNTLQTHNCLRPTKLELTLPVNTSTELEESLYTDFIKDLSGRTQDQFNRQAYKRMCRSFSSKGEPITVSNAEEGYVLSGKIEGQSVKNHISLERYEDYGIWAAHSQYFELLDDGYLKWTTNGERICINTNIDCYSVKPNTVYTMIIFVRNNTIGDDISFKCNDSPTGMFEEAYAFTNLKTGINKFKLTTKEDLTQSTIGQQSYLLPDQQGSIETKYMLLEGDWTNKELSFSQPITGDICSTKAIISNNDVKCNFYETIIKGTEEGIVPNNSLLPVLRKGDVLDLATKTITFANNDIQILTNKEAKAYDAHKKLIVLNKIDDTLYDTLEILEDGSGIYTSKTVHSVIDKNYDGWSKLSVHGGNNYRLLESKFTQSAKTGSRKITTIPFKSVHFYSNMSLYFEPSNEELGLPYGAADATLAQERFLEIMSKHDYEIVYERANPVVMHIPKELMPAILTYEGENTITIDSVIQPSKLELSLPVDKIGELELRLQALENTVIDAVLNK